MTRIKLFSQIYIISNLKEGTIGFLISLSELAPIPRMLSPTFEVKYVVMFPIPFKAHRDLYESF